MAKRMPWFKMPTDLSHWPPAQLLDHVELGIWLRVMGEASASPIRGTLLIAEGVPHTTETLARALKLGKDEVALLQAALDKMAAVGYLGQNGTGLLELPHWQEEQEPPAWLAPDAVRQRVSDHRQRQKTQKAQQEEWERRGLCGKCGSPDHTKYVCPLAKYRHVVKTGAPDDGERQAEFLSKRGGRVHRGTGKSKS